jgi:hypothetical protein
MGVLEGGGRRCGRVVKASENFPKSLRAENNGFVV